uniref:LAGLIDADG endonuclease n=1 Tax=Cryphonectria parasitica TaxID=5116 RepID=A0A191MXK0_CRYPA|nr:LAGLIDADG endonuclease [Cryphonectria parasitica]
MKNFNKKLLYTNQPKVYNLNVSTISRILLTKLKVPLLVLGLSRNYSTAVPKGTVLPSEGVAVKNSTETEFDFKSDININLTPWWVTGIIDSEGNFSIVTQKTSAKSGYKISLTLKVTQKEHSKGILLALQKYFGCGNIYIDNKKENAYKFSVSKIEDILYKIIPHLDKYPLVTSKNLDYADFRRIALLMKDKLHLNSEVIDEILLIKNNMNSLRTFEERWNYFQNIEPIKLINEWVQAFVDGEGCFQFGIINTVNRGKPYLALVHTLEVAQSNHDVWVLAALIEFFGCGYIKPKYNLQNLDEAKKSRIVNRFIVNQHAVVTEFFDKYPLFTRKRLDYLEALRAPGLVSKYLFSFFFNKYYLFFFTWVQCIVIERFKRSNWYSPCFVS